MVVNTIIGDESFLHTYHLDPHLFPFLQGSPAFEDLRIHTHLLYVHKQLSDADCSALSPNTKKKRLAGLRHLKEYAEEGVYPRNYGSDVREPSFVDKDGRLCAVAHIMSKAGETALVKEIDTLFHNCKLHDMHHPKLTEWISQSGFTLKELASIQPGYPPFHYCFSTFFYVLMSFFIGISAVIQYEHSMSPAPPHYRQILFALVINNFIGFVFSVCVCLIATMTRQARLQIIPIGLRWIWTTVNLTLLGYYIGHIQANYDVPNKTNHLLLAGLIFTCICIAVSVSCDLCGVLIQGQLNHKFKWGRNRRGPDGELKSETDGGEIKNEDVELGEVSVSVANHKEENVDEKANDHGG